MSSNDSDSTLAFVREWATVETYGGGQRASFRIGDTYLSALDGWEGRDAALGKLADEVASSMAEAR